MQMTLKLIKYCLHISEKPLQEYRCAFIVFLTIVWAFCVCLLTLRV